MGRDVGMSLLVSVVLLNIVKVVSSHDDSSLHLGGNDYSLDDSSSDGNVTGEWAFLVNVTA